MTNDKCKMINDKGYALISMTFILVSFLSVVLLVCYPLFKEAKEASASYIIDRNDYRFRKAMFGEVVDQCGTKLVHQGGHYSDYDDGGRFGTKLYYYHARVTARLFGTLGYVDKDLGLEEMEVPKDYKYTADTFWAGYWGKRFLHILPSDKWDYTTLYEKLGNYQYNLYTPYRQPYASIFTASVCGGIIGYKNFAKGCLEDYTNFKYCTYETVFVKVKDYSEKKTQHELRLITIGSGNYYEKEGEQNIFFERVDKDTQSADYVLYEFEQIRSGKSSKTAQDSGQKKLIIQVKEDASDSWITMDTILLVCPPCYKCSTGSTGTRLTFMVNFYG